MTKISSFIISFKYQCSDNIAQFMQFSRANDNFQAKKGERPFFPVIPRKIKR